MSHTFEVIIIGYILSTCFTPEQYVRMVVDQCRDSVIDERENAPHSMEDRRHCESVGETKGPNKYLNVNTPLQLGGIADHTLRHPANLPRHGFSGCIKNLVHDGEVSQLSQGFIQSGYILIKVG